MKRNLTEEQREIVDKIYKQLKKCHYLIWQSPQSFGQKDVVNWSDIQDIFDELR